MGEQVAVLAAADDRAEAVLPGAGPLASRGQARAGAEPLASGGQAEAGAGPLDCGELLVEEVSIDGMCGVY